MGFGIPVETIPITNSGNIKRTFLYQWIKVRKIIELNEASEMKDSIIILPGSNDVLIRCGTTTVSHPGNVFFRGLIELKHEECKSGSEHTQAFLAERIVEEIERLGGRFLQWENLGYWTELKERKQILFKVEVSIRDFKAKMKAITNQQSPNSSTHSFRGQDGSTRKRKNISSEGFDATDSSAVSESCFCAC